MTATLVDRVPTLQGRTCILRALLAADAPALQRHADDPAVAHNLFDGFPQPYTLAQAEAWCGHEHRLPHLGNVWGIAVEADEIAGCISVAPNAGIWGCSATVGYWLGRQHWGRGIVPEALRLVTEWTWQALPQITRLCAPIYARNAASQAVARKAGYVQEGVLPYSILNRGQAIHATVWGSYRPGLPAVRQAA